MLVMLHVIAQALSARSLISSSLSLLLLLPSASSLATSHVTTISTSVIRTRTTTITVQRDTATATVPQTASTAMSWSGDTFAQAVLNSTNTYRSQHQARPLTWNDTLATFAQNHAQGCIWEHSGGPYGENLAEGYATPALAIGAWVIEDQHYNYKKGRFGENTGHFTQLVWTNTTTVGCGAANCNNTASDGADGWYLVCEYYPPGNVGGEYKDNVFSSSGGNGGLLSVGHKSGGNNNCARWLASLFIAGLVSSTLVLN